jgi:uncharacterized Zn ribbon protein
MGKDKMKKEKKYTYQDVKEILCQACKHKVPDMWTIRANDTIIEHILNGQKVRCKAEVWRLREARQ